MRHEIRLSGAGGQGLITAGIIIAKAAALYDNKNAVQSQSYGPEARGGASKAEVIISDEDIYFPKVHTPDLLVALTQEAYNKYSSDLKDDSLVIIDNMLVKEYSSDHRVIALPIISTAVDVVGNIMTANIITLSALNTLYPIVSDKALEDIVLNTFPPKAREKNLKALQCGKELANSVNN